MKELMKIHAHEDPEEAYDVLAFSGGCAIVRCPKTGSLDRIRDINRFRQFDPTSDKPQLRFIPTPQEKMLSHTYAYIMRKGIQAEILNHTIGQTIMREVNDEFIYRRENGERSKILLSDKDHTHHKSLWQGGRS